MKQRVTLALKVALTQVGLSAYAQSVLYRLVLLGHFHTMNMMKSETRIFFRMASGNQELTAGADGLPRTSGDSHVEGATNTWRRGNYTS